jgi:uncharacterized membrane protein YgaE (UPF0421/DUF939 family)
VREGWRRLRRLGLRRWLTLERDTLLRIAKTALAATVAWELSIVLLHSTLPALAALGAILTVQVTVKQTVTFGVQQVVGVTVGVGGALVLVGVLGVHLWTVALLILAALIVGNLLRLGRQVNQVAISAVLVLALGTGEPGLQTGRARRGGGGGQADRGAHRAGARRNPGSAASRGR